MKYKTKFFLFFFVAGISDIVPTRGLEINRGEFNSCSFETVSKLVDQGCQPWGIDKSMAVADDGFSPRIIFSKDKVRAVFADWTENKAESDMKSTVFTIFCDKTKVIEVGTELTVKFEPPPFPLPPKEFFEKYLGRLELLGPKTLSCSYWNRPMRPQPWVDVILNATFGPSSSENEERTIVEIQRISNEINPVDITGFISMQVLQPSYYDQDLRKYVYPTNNQLEFNLYLEFEPSGRSGEWKEISHKEVQALDKNGNSVLKDESINGKIIGVGTVRLRLTGKSKKTDLMFPINVVGAKIISNECIENENGNCIDF